MPPRSTVFVLFLHQLPQVKATGKVARICDVILAEPIKLLLFTFCSAEILAK